MNMHKRVFPLIISALCCAGLSSATTVLIDFGTGASAPTGSNTWNVAVSGNVTNLLDTSGNGTGINLTFSGNAPGTSTNTDGWTHRTVTPSWADNDLNALADRLFNSNGETGSLTISGLDTGLTYNFELASAFHADGGAAGSNPGYYNLVDANGVDGTGICTPNLRLNMRGSGFEDRIHMRWPRFMPSGPQVRDDRSPVHPRAGKSVDGRIHE